MADTAISLTLDGTPDLPSTVLQSLYRITGRSTVELRRSVQRREPLFSATLFGIDHIDAVPRLEKTVAHLTDIGLPFTVQEHVDGSPEEISLETLREILEG
ncbi:hypothetical protein [uncultured Microbacterium sp.]|uniref:hypothetical protein n=1 Tax=uncultured Microbacterium sp. TaxID=191216 RepID=UPI00262FDC7F|nr:hypothetical protein [uncultured Microbacterium sp.]